MKRFAQGLLAVAMGLGVASTAYAFTGSYSAGAGINNTVHDIPHGSGLGGYKAAPADTLNRICIFCHAPHNTYKLSTAQGGPGSGAGAGPVAPDDFDYLPLWNHTPTANAGAFTMYQPGPGAPTLGHAAPQSVDLMTQPGGSSLLCLSCHDGSVAVSQYGNTDQLERSRGSSGIPIVSVYQIGKDGYLGNHHPIGFNYETVKAADSQIRVSTTALTSGGDQIKDHLYGAGNTQMECGTCHSVHNKGNDGETLLWRSDTGSALCLTCHNKGDYVAP